MNDREWMIAAIDLSKRCPQSPRAYSVGAILVDQHGTELVRGYSRETDPKVHAEEASLGKLRDHPGLAASTLYSTLEPCSERGSAGRTPCADLIVERGIGRVVIAWREPSRFVADCVGVERLRDAGVTVVEMPELAEAARAVNSHLA